MYVVFLYVGLLRMTLGWLQGVIFQPSGSTTPSFAISRVILSPSNSTSSSQVTVHLYVACLKLVAYVKIYLNIIKFVDEHF